MVLYQNFIVVLYQHIELFEQRYVVIATSKCRIKNRKTLTRGRLHPGAPQEKRKEASSIL
jgi:hypothetical protein